MTTLTLKRNHPAEVQPSQCAQDKTSQAVPPQLKTGSHVKVNAKKKKRRIARIAEHWVLFNEPEIKPLMIGIKEAMIAEANKRGLDIPERHIKQGLHSYISRKAYLRALTLGGNRFDMNGQPSGEITPEQQAVAERRLLEWAKGADEVNDENHGQKGVNEPQLRG